MRLTTDHLNFWHRKKGHSTWFKPDKPLVHPSVHVLINQQVDKLDSRHHAGNLLALLRGPRSRGESLGNQLATWSRTCSDKKRRALCLRWLAKIEEGATR